MVNDLGGDPPAGALADQAGDDVGGRHLLPRHVAGFVHAELDVLVVDLLQQRLDDAPGLRRAEQAQRPRAAHQP
jgi:hypothetical protein